MNMVGNARYPREIRERAMRMGRELVAATTAIVLVVAPNSAAAATKRVGMGLPSGVQKKFDSLKSDVDAFFPATVSVHVGSTVRFVPDRPRAPGASRSLLRQPNAIVGYHTVDFPARGRGPLAFVTPVGEKADQRDAAGARFWFRGFDVFGANPKLLTRTFGTTLRYDGSKRLTSGLPEIGVSRPVTVRFARAGTYTYFCNIHPGMKGIVRVLPKGRPVPSVAADRKTVSAQVKAALRTAKSLVHSRVARRVKNKKLRINIGQAGAGGVERFAFARASFTVPRGTTVKFAMPAASRETHTAATGPGNPSQDDSYLGKLAKSFESTSADPVAAFPSDAPTLGPVGLTPKLHGNGFWNTGVLDAFGPSLPPADQSVRFSKAGTYRFYCLIHPFMRTTITVR